MISTIDLSSVTDRIIAYLEQAVDAWPGWIAHGGAIPRFPIVVSGKMPESVRNAGECQMTLYLFHLIPEPYTRNTPLTGTRAQTNKSQALGLTLYYLLTTYAKESYVQEQQAIGIALQAFHERGTFIDPVDGFTFTVTFEPEKDDAANRRWQSFSTPFRLSAVFRVSVVFLTAPVTPPAPAPAPRRIGLSTGPTALPFARAGALTGTASEVDFTPLAPVPGDTIVHQYSPAVVAPGGQFSVFGAGIDQNTAHRLYLLDEHLVETEVTAWKGAPALQSATRLTATLPAAIGAVPGGSPQPGTYQLRVGSALAAGDATDYRSNSVLLLIAAHVTPLPSPWTPAGGVFSVGAVGLIDGATELYLDTIVLHRIAPGGAPAAGQFALSIAGDSLKFRPPAGLPAGTYYVRLRVRGIEGPPIGRITLP
jgi:hypothetical protein